MNSPGMDIPYYVYKVMDISSVSLWHYYTKSAINIFVQVLVWRYPGIQLLSNLRASYVALEVEMPDDCPRRSAILHYQVLYLRVLIFYITVNLILEIFAILVCEVYGIVISICIPLVVHYVQCIFLCEIAICMSFGMNVC